MLSSSWLATKQILILSLIKKRLNCGLKIMEPSIFVLQSKGISMQESVLLNLVKKYTKVLLQKRAIVFCSRKGGLLQLKRVESAVDINFLVRLLFITIINYYAQICQQSQSCFYPYPLSEATFWSFPNIYALYTHSFEQSKMGVKSTIYFPLTKKQ